MKGTSKDNGIVVILVFLMIVGGLYMSQIFAPVGFTTLSLSQADFTSNNPFFSGNVWIMTVAQQGLGQHAYGIVDGDELGDETGTYAARDFSIDITYSEQTCEYPIQQDYYAERISKYNFITYPLGLDFCTDQATALAYCPNGIFFGKEVGLNCFCINEVPLTGAVSPFIENPTVRTQSRIEVQNQISSDYLDVDTSGEVSGFIGNDVYVTWNGNLMKDSCTSQAPYYGFYASGEWELGYKSNYDYYTTIKSSRMALSELQKCNGDGTCLRNSITETNTAADRAMINANFGSIRSPYQLSGAVITKDLPTLIQVPVYTFYVKSDYLGIYQPAPVPQIVDLNSNSFKSGEIGEIYALIRNAGEAGNMEIWAECQSPFQYVETTKTISLSEDESRAVYLEISADTSAPITRTCTVYLKALDIIESATVSVEVDPNQVCTPNREVCEDNVRKKCNEFGSAYGVIAACLSTQECRYNNDGSTGCFDIDEVPGGCGFLDIGCYLSGLSKQLQDFWNGFAAGSFWYLIAIVAILFMVLLISGKVGKGGGTNININR